MEKLPSLKSDIEIEQKASDVQRTSEESKSEKPEVGIEAEAFRLSRKVTTAQGLKKAELATELLGLLDILEKTAGKNKIFDEPTIGVERRRMNEIIKNLGFNN